MTFLQRHFSYCAFSMCISLCEAERNACIKYFAKNNAKYIFYEAVVFYTHLCFCLNLFKDKHRNP